MSGIRACDEYAMVTKGSYDIIQLWPCVTFPLVLAPFTLGFAWRRLHLEWSLTTPAVRKASAGILTLETIVGIACLSQCIIMFAANTFAGKVPACSFQALYTGFYLMAYPSVVAALSLFTRLALDNNLTPLQQALAAPTPSTPETLGAAAPASDEPTRPFPRGTRVLETLPRRLGLILAIILIWAAFVAAWPMIGLAPDGYVFPSLYCLLNLTHPLIGTLYVMGWCTMIIALAYGMGCVMLRQPVPAQTSDRTKPSTECRLRLICAGAIVQAALSQLPAILITVLGFVGYNRCDNALPMPYFGLLAFATHMNQLVSPILYGVLWRRELSSRMVKYTQQERARIGLA